jgi:predicted PurR-regulated permease PerM
VGDVNVMLGSYIRAQLILASLTLLVYTVVLSLKYSFILGPLAGIFEFVPVVGPAIAALIVFVIAVLTSYPHLIWVVLFLGIWRVVQDYVNAPRIMGKSLEISPLVQIFAVLAGGEIGGVVGALISVPAVATLRILWKRLTSEKGPDAPVAPISGDASSLDGS